MRSIQDDNDKRSLDFPSRAFGAHSLHVYRGAGDDGEWSVWLNTEASDFDGLCLALGETRNIALGRAVAVLEAAVEMLQEPPEAWPHDTSGPL